ncbi:hypothetical protein DY252_16230 [Thalassospira indica]|uniref:Secreted protein n=1 Tax=Thalassospira indica TaxID=1891279 RepID=A0ABM6Y276_9PROT|nr:hypothetical protein DY252_16230 [Thalassospira indica]KZD00454.1 hypothetical protein AUQ41_07710 [Thalassospira sp. MCCC 1A02898]ONH87282.1 hypothetical protein TH47_11990 [Thalassospira sp. MCCC 1A02803]
MAACMYLMRVRGGGAMTRTTCVLFSPGANRNCEVKSASLWNGEFPFRTWAMMVCLFSVGGFGRHLRPKKPYTVVALSKSYGFQ